MDACAPLADLHAAAVYVSERLKAYVSEEDGYIHGVGIPHAFAGSWEVRALSEGLGGGIGEGFEASRLHLQGWRVRLIRSRPGSQEIICLTPASNRHLRQAFHAQPHHCLSPTSPASTSSTGHLALASPVDSTYFSAPHLQHSPGSFNLGYGYAGNGYSTSNSDEEGKSVELHCHPKSGVPMTVIVDLGDESVSGKKIRIDMLQAGE